MVAKLAPPISTNRKIRPRIWNVTYLLNRSISLSLKQQIANYFPKNWSGRILDVGCGQQPYRGLFEDRCKEYIGCDLSPKLEGIIACPADKLIFTSGSFDAVVCFQVLEHVREPWRVMEECKRVLKPGGILMVTAPFIFSYHASPQDFYRFTHEGLQYLAERCGFEVTWIEGQCTSLPTLCLLLNNYVASVWGFLSARLILRPLAWLTVVVGIIPINIIGIILRNIPLAHRYDYGNTGFSNYLMIAQRNKDS